MQPFSLLALAPQMRQAIIRACEEAIAWTVTQNYPTVIAEKDAEIQQFRQQLEDANKKHYSDYSEFCDVTSDNQRLRQQVTLLKDLVEEVRREHRDDQCAGYNECDKSPCKWCADAIEAMKK